jgi:cobalt-zinc-cadmium efflux system protein
MLTAHVLVDGDDADLTNALLRSIHDRITSDFGIKHMTIQLETHCCDPDDVHCDLTKLAAQHQPIEALHSH